MCCIPRRLCCNERVAKWFCVSKVWKGAVNLGKNGTQWNICNLIRLMVIIWKMVFYVCEIFFNIFGINIPPCFINIFPPDYAIIKCLETYECLQIPSIVLWNYCSKFMFAKPFSVLKLIFQTNFYLIIKWY